MTDDTKADVEVEPRSALAERVLDAAIECLSRWGMSKTTAEDIAKAAGVSRATMYRAFPGGLTAIFEAMSARQVERLISEVSAVAHEGETLAASLTEAMCAAGRFLETQSAFQYLLRHEPHVLLPYFAFDNIGPVLAYCTEILSPALERFVPRHVAEELVEWGARMVLSLTFTPGLADVTDQEEVGDLVENLLLPGYAEELRDIDIALKATTTDSPVAVH